MSAPALSPTSSLATIRDDLVFTSSRLLSDPSAKALEELIVGLLKEWSLVQNKQFKLWDDQAKADALIAAADDNLDDFIPVFAHAVRALPGGEKGPNWSLFFRVAPYEVAAPVLGGEVEAVRRWSTLLEKSNEPTLAAKKKALDKLISNAASAVTARDEAALAGEHFRSQGDLAKFFENATRTRDSIAAELTLIAAKSETLPRNYPSRFFRKRVNKLSAEEKAAKVVRKAEAKQRKTAAEAAIKAAQAKVKAAMVELKAMTKAKSK